MAEKSLFFNAFPDASTPTGYDRNYNADDISDWLSIVCATGVVKDGLQVTADGSALGVTVQVGKATIMGKAYINNAKMPLSLETAPTGSSPRYDLIILRMDNTQSLTARKIYLMTQTGTTSIPTVSSLTRTSEIYDLLLAYVQVNPNATSVSQTNVIDCRGDETLCPWFVAVKGYDDYYDAIVQQFESNVTMASAGTVVVTDLASILWNQKYSIIDVYCNGLKEENTDYTVNTSSGYITITFTSRKSAGAQISVVLSNYIDGEGMSTAISQYTQWVQDVSDLKSANSYTYVCNGSTDNIEISRIVNAFRSGGTDYGSLRLNIVGAFGCVNASGYANTVGGSGTSSSPYQIFHFDNGNRKVILDFTNCGAISVPISGVYATIFDTSNIEIIGANVIVTGTSSGTSVDIFGNDSGMIKCKDCRFWLNTYSGGVISKTGTFENCRASVLNMSGNSYCFLPSDTGLVRIIGGEYMAYCSSGNISAVVGQSAVNACSILYGVNAPTVSRSGYVQTNALYQVSSGGMINCSDLITTLTVTTISGKANIRGTISMSKAGLM